MTHPPAQRKLVLRLEHEGATWEAHHEPALPCRILMPEDRHVVRRLEEARGAGPALVAAPEVLVLDEPTNHLDLAAIEWLEELLKIFAGGVLFVTHDRRFLDNVATRIIELDRGQLASFPGNFSAFQRRKQEMLEVEEVQNAKFDKVLAQEEVWIRKGIKARRTRNEGRVRRLEQLRRERAHGSSAGKVRLATRCRRSLRQAGGGTGASQQVLRRQAHHPRFLHAHHARRPHRPDRAERRRQDHPAQAHPGRVAARLAAR